MSSKEQWVEIETKLTHQEVLLEDLHQVIYRQQKTIDLLETKLNALVQRLKDGGGEREIGPANEKPPHY